MSYTLPAFAAVSVSAYITGFNILLYSFSKHFMICLVSASIFCVNIEFSILMNSTPSMAMGALIDSIAVMKQTISKQIRFFMDVCVIYIILLDND